MSSSPSSWSEHPEKLQLRVSDADRHQVAEILREAAGEGRLGLDELDQRLEATFQATTYADLVPITLDLPAPYAARPVPAGPVDLGKPGAPVAASRPERHLAILSGFERKGVWTVPPHLVITAVMGGAELDMRQAVFAGATCTLTINAVMGGVNVKVPPGVDVVFAMTSIMGGHSDPGSTGATGGPTLVIKGFCLMGGVNVERRA